MHEVHLPHKAIESIKEFSTHILTITVGLLIAVGIERFVEWRHHQNMAQEARDTMRSEIEGNAKKMEKAIVDIETHQKELQKNIDAITRLQRSGEPAKDLDSVFTTNFSLVRLEDTSWQTARTTGAFAFMPYEEARMLNSVYAAQTAFLTKQDVVVEDLAMTTGLLRTTTHGDTGQMSAESADALAQRFGIWETHLAMVHLMARVVTEQQHAFLEGRQPKVDLHEAIGTEGGSAP